MSRANRILALLVRICKERNVYENRVPSSDPLDLRASMANSAVDDLVCEATALVYPSRQRHLQHS